MVVRFDHTPRPKTLFPQHSFMYCTHYINSFIHASHPFTHCIHPMRYIHSCATFTHMLYRIYSSLSMYVLYSFMNLIHPRIHALHSLVRCIAPILLFSCISHIASYPLGQYSPLSRITYMASYGHSYLLACIISLSYIKSNV